VASFLDDADVSTRKISDQLGHAKVSMTQDTYLGRRLTDRQTADVREGMFPGNESQERPGTTTGQNRRALTCWVVRRQGLEPRTR
jgi:hypothetical protein